MSVFHKIQDNTNSYPVGYEYADLRHLNKHQNINGQFIYVSLIDINSKPFAAVIKLDDFAKEKYAKFKDIAVKEMTPAVRGSTGKNNLANLPDQVSDITIQHLVDFVKQHFEGNDLFTEDIADVFDKRLDKAYFAALDRGDMETASAMVKNANARSIYHAASDYQGSLAFNGSAPSKNEYYKSKEDRADAWSNGDYEGEFSLGDFTDNGIDTHDLKWQLKQGKSLYLYKEKAQSLIAQQRTNLAEVSNLDLNPINNIIENFKNASDNFEFSRQRLHQQINPVVRDGVVREEYADLLANKEYTPERLEEWGRKAEEWILRQGGVTQAAQKFLKDLAPGEKHVANLARRMIINNDVFANNFTRKERTKLYEMEVEERSSWGKAGRTLQLAALKPEDYENKKGPEFPVLFFIQKSD